MKKGIAIDSHGQPREVQIMTPIENAVDAALCELRNARGATWGMLKMAEADDPDDYQDLVGLKNLLCIALRSLWENLDSTITDLESVAPEEVTK